MLPDPCNGQRPDCSQNSTRRRRGLCQAHYTRWKRYGDIETVKPRGHFRKQHECSVEDCTAVPKARGWCDAHYQRYRKHGDVKPEQPHRSQILANKPPCEVEGCDRVSDSLGLCGGHYKRLYKYGDVDPDRPFRAKYYEGDDRDCTVDGCSGRIKALELCGFHYTRHREGKSFDDPRLANYSENPDCSEPDCNRRAVGNQLCRTHYNKNRSWRHIPRKQVDARIEYYGGKCWICLRAPYEHIDHVKPLSRGGAHLLSNLRPACAQCNIRKNASWPFDVDEFRLKYNL